MYSDKILDGRLKIRHLTYFATIAEHGTIIGAAEALHVTQPVVTRALHEIEVVLGHPLFVRGPRGVTLTIYGESFLTHARSLLAQLRRAGQDIELLARADLGTVTVGTHLAGSNLLLPRAIAALKRNHPKLTVVVREATPDALQNSLLTGDVDLTLGRIVAAKSNRLEQEKLYLEPIKLVARSGHPIHSVEAPELEELVRYPWILPGAQTALRNELEDLFANENLPLPTDRVECTSMLTLHHLLVDTDAIAALPLYIALGDEKLRIIATDLQSIGQNVGIMKASDRPVSPSAELLIEHLRDQVSKLQLATLS